MAPQSSAISRAAKPLMLALLLRTSGEGARVRIRRAPKRAVYDRAQIDAILDEAIVCHVGFVVDEQPYDIPTLHARVGDVVYLHGSAASRMVRNNKRRCRLARL